MPQDRPLYDDDYVARISAAAVKLALEQDRTERDRQVEVSTRAAVAAALQNHNGTVQSLRKPELPALDKTNIDAWIRRVEHAFTRCFVTKPKDKFSFLEGKFGQDDPQINRLFEGEQQQDWDNFISYLKEQFGRTKEQEVASLLQGIARDGRRPSNHAALILEKTKNITLDDIRKEVLLKEYPAEVRRHVGSKIKSLDFTATAKLLDEYYDQRGKLLHSSNASSINQVSANTQHNSRPLQSALRQEQLSRASSQSSNTPSESSSFTSAYEEDDSTDVHAVRFRSGQRQQFNINNGGNGNRQRSQSRGRQRNDSGHTSSSYSNNNSNNRAPSRYSNSGNNNNNNRSSSRQNSGTGSSSNNWRDSKNKVCFFHNQYGAKARSCEEGCMMYEQHQAAKGQASH